MKNMNTALEKVMALPSGGDVWNRQRIVMHTDELEREININKKRRAKIATELQNTNWYNQPLEVLEWVKDTVTNPPPANMG
jgi:hypothetical protein